MGVFLILTAQGSFIVTGSGDKNSESLISFNEDPSLGLDLRKFDGIVSELSLFIKLVSGNQCIYFSKQTLANSKKVLVTVGLIANLGEDIGFLLGVQKYRRYNFVFRR